MQNDALNMNDGTEAFRGGFGDVKQGVLTGNGLLVAVKTLRPRGDPDEARRLRTHLVGLGPRGLLATPPRS